MIGTINVDIKRMDATLQRARISHSSICGNNGHIACLIYYGMDELPAFVNKQIISALF